MAQDIVDELRKEFKTKKPPVGSDEVQTAVVEIPELHKETDEIKTVFTNSKGQVEKIVFTDENTITFKDFLDVLKANLRTIMAGEIISWDDVWRFQKQTDARAMEEYLDNVEQEGILKGSRFQLSRSQKISVGVVIIVVFVMIFAMYALRGMT